MDELTDTERRVLDFEASGSHWKFAGRKDALIREFFDVSPTVYYARLAALIERPEAWAYNVVLVKRLRSIQEQRRAVRTA